MINNSENQKGYVTLISVLLLGSVLISLVSGKLLITTSTSQNQIRHEAMVKAKNYANGCAEEGLEVLRENNSYLGSGSLTFSDGGCAYTVTSLGGGSVQLNATSSINDVSAKIKVIVTAFNPKITIQSWEQVADF